MTPQEIYDAVKAKTEEWHSNCDCCNEFSDAIDLTLDALKEVLELKKENE